MIFNNPVTITEALRYEQAQQVVTLSPSIGSRDVQDFMSAQIREKAFLSARTPYPDYLDETRRDIQSMVQPDVKIGPDGLVKTGKGESISPAQVRAKMKRRLTALGYEPDPDKRGGLQDLSSDTRTNLIIDTQLKMARGYGSWRQSQDESILDVYPADEMYRAMSRQERRDWHVRWNKARGRLGSATSATYAEDRDAGPFVAKKNDPIWRAISRFGHPYPPFDFRSGMRVRDVTRARAVALKVIKPAQKVRPTKDPMTRPWSMDMEDSSPEVAQALQDAFGPRAMLQGGKLHLMPHPTQTMEELIYRAANNEDATGAFAFVNARQQAQASKIIGKNIEPGATYAVDSSHIRHIRKTHGIENPVNPMPVTPEDIRDLPSIVRQGKLRKPTKGNLQNVKAHDVQMDTDSGLRVGLRYSEKQNHFLVTTMYKRLQ